MNQKILRLRIRFNKWLKHIYMSEIIDDQKTIEQLNEDIEHLESHLE